MSEIINTSVISMQSYIDSNRNKLDESLVSLRLMKEVDDFLDINNVNQSDFACALGYSEAYVSQLMSGTKKFNTSFINKIEKAYEIEINFKIKSREESNFFSKFSNSTIEISVNIFNSFPTDNIYKLENSYHDYFQLNSDFLKLEE